MMSSDMRYCAIKRTKESEASKALLRTYYGANLILCSPIEHCFQEEQETQNLVKHIKVKMKIDPGRSIPWMVVKKQSLLYK